MADIGMSSVETMDSTTTVSFVSHVYFIIIISSLSSSSAPSRIFFLSIPHVKFLSQNFLHLPQICIAPSLVLLYFHSRCHGLPLLQCPAGLHSNASHGKWKSFIWWASPYHISLLISLISYYFSYFDLFSAHSFWNLSWSVFHTHLQNPTSDINNFLCMSLFIVLHSNPCSYKFNNTQNIHFSVVYIYRSRNSV